MSALDALDALTAELTEFCLREGLPQRSADDLGFGATREQRVWLADFIVRWDDAALAEDCARRVVVS